MNNSYEREHNGLNSSNVDSLEKRPTDNSTTLIMQTKPLPIKENRIYNYTVTMEAKNVTNSSAVASFRNSSDVSENSTKYGRNASNGRILSLSPGSEIYTKLDIIKPSSYRVVVRANTCANCTFLKVNMIEDNNVTSNTIHSIQSSNISLKNNISELKWLNSNGTYSLDKGTYELRIYSDSQADLDSVLIYPLNNYSSSANTNHIKQNQTLDGLFSANDAPPPADILEYKKINPTKHILKIENATRPYILAFAESYDPLWTAYIDSSDGSIKPNDNKDSSFKTNSIPLYGVTNGFYVNKKGDYGLVIEYEPQKWYLEGVIMSLFSLATILIVALISKKKHLSVLRREK